MQKTYDNLVYRPKTDSGGENPYPIELKSHSGIWAIEEDHFKRFFQEYIEQKHEFQMKALENDQIGERTDARNLSINAIENLAHNLARGWNESALFDERLFEELIEWIKALNKLRPTFGDARFFPNAITSQKIINLHVKLPKLIKAEFKFRQEIEEKKLRLNEKS